MLKPPGQKGSADKKVDGHGRIVSQVITFGVLNNMIADKLQNLAFLHVSCTSAPMALNASVDRHRPGARSEEED